MRSRAHSTLAVAGALALGVVVVAGKIIVPMVAAVLP